MGTELFIVTATGSGRPDYSLDAIVVTDYVYFDAGSPYTGITYPVGTARFPVNNVADLVAICADRSLFNIMLLSNITLDRNMIGYNFEGRVSQIVDLAGFAIDESTFRRLLVTGAQAVVTTLPPWFDECYLYTLTAFNASIVHGCILAAAIGLGGNLIAFECAFYAGFTLQTNGRNFNITGSTGELTVTQYNVGGAYSYLEMLAGKVTFAASCNNGTIEIRGDFVLFDNSAGTVVIDYRVSTHIAAIEEAVYFDSVGGVAGTTYPIGTPQHPVNNEADLFTILTARGLRKVILLTPTSTLTFSAARSGYNFVGEGVFGATPTVDFNGRAITCTFDNLRITDGTGTNLVSVSEFTECLVAIVIAHTVGGSNYHKCQFVAGISNPPLGIINCYDDCIWLGDFSNTTGTVNIHGDCKVIHNLANTTGRINIYGDCRVDFRLTNTTGIIDIFGNCYVSNYIENTTGEIRVWGNCQVGDGIYNTGIAGSILIYGNCQTGTNIENTNTGDIQIYGNCDVGADIRNTSTGHIQINGGCCVGYDVRNNHVLGYCQISLSRPNPTLDLLLGATSVTQRIVNRGSLTVAQMVAGATAIIDLSGGTLTIAASCTGGTIDLYGDCKIVDNSGGLVTVNDRRANKYIALDFWSVPQEEVQVTSGAGAKALPSVTVAGVTTNATIIRVVALVRFRVVENTFAGANNLDGAQEIQVRSDAPGAWVDAINFVANMFTFTAAGREGGLILEGAIDIKATVVGDDTYNFQWDAAVAAQNNLQFNDVQVGLRVYFTP